MDAFGTLSPLETDVIARPSLTEQALLNRLRICSQVLTYLTCCGFRKEPGRELSRCACPPVPAAGSDLGRRVRLHCVHRPREAAVHGEEGRVPWFVHKHVCVEGPARYLLLV